MSVHLEALIVGMTYDEEGNLYRANGKRRTKGFATKEEAIAQRKEWECLLVT